MEIVCENCNAKLSLADEKVQPGQRVSVSCPRCKEKLTIDANDKGQKEFGSQVDADSLPKETKTATALAYEAEGSGLDFLDKNVNLALVMENDATLSEKIGKAIDELGYKHILAENTNQAISKMRFHNFKVVILSDAFDGIKLDQSPILQYLNHLSMSVRRKMFVALIGDSFNTMDHMMAFCMSANLVVNRRDLDNLAGILSNAISDNDKFYKVFTDTLAEVGRA